MKKWLALICFFLLGFSSLGAYASAKYTNGLYRASAKGFGGDVTVEITIQDGHIAGVAAEGPNETPGIGSKALAELPGKIVATNGVENVDAIAGATLTSNAVLNAAAECLEAAKTGTTSTPSPVSTATPTPTPTPQPAPPSAHPEYHNGTYIAQVKGFGGMVTVSITIADGWIVEVEAEGANETSGIGSRALTELPAKIVDVNGVDGVDNVAGATITSRAVLEAAAECLRLALNGATSAPTITPTPAPTPTPTPPPVTAHPEYHDGAYTAQATGFGGAVTVSMIILDGWIVEVETEGENEVQAIGGRALAELPDKIIAANGVENVDAIASATYTSKAVLKAAAQCLEQAVDTATDDRLSVIRIPEGVQIVEKESFCHTAAVFIVIPNGCKEIESRAFAGNAALRWVLIPSSVQQIAEDAFADCGDYQIFIPPYSNEYTDAAGSSME